jgi:phosphohistidine phosphatase
MAREGLVPNLAIVSSARRTQETWDLVHRAFAGNLHFRGEPRIYEASSDAILAIVRETAPHVERLLLVGHNPGLQDLALEVIGKGSRSELHRLRAKYPTAGLVVIDFDVPGWNRIGRKAGRLERFETPKSIAGD